MAGAQAVFLDRDGVLARTLFFADTGEYEGPRRVEQLALYDETIPALRTLIEAGYTLFLVSNQPNFAKGKGTLQELRAIHDRFLTELRAAGVELKQSYFCFHHPTSLVPGYGVCDCRKPSPKFLLEAAGDYHLDLTRSWMVGDRPSDVECGQRAAVRTIRIKPYPPGPIPEEPQADYLAENIREAVGFIVGER